MGMPNLIIGIVNTFLVIIVLFLIFAIIVVSVNGRLEDLFKRKIGNIKDDDIDGLVALYSKSNCFYRKKILKELLRRSGESGENFGEFFDRVGYAKRIINMSLRRRNMMNVKNMASTKSSKTFDSLLEHTKCKDLGIECAAYYGLLNLEIKEEQKLMVANMLLESSLSDKKKAAVLRNLNMSVGNYILYAKKLKNMEVI